MKGAQAHIAVSRSPQRHNLSNDLNYINSLLDQSGQIRIAHDMMIAPILESQKKFVRIKRQTFSLYPVTQPKSRGFSKKSTLTGHHKSHRDELARIGVCTLADRLPHPPGDGTRECRVLSEWRLKSLLIGIRSRIPHSGPASLHNVLFIGHPAYCGYRSDVRLTLLPSVNPATFFLQSHSLVCLRPVRRL